MTLYPLDGSTRSILMCTAFVLLLFALCVVGYPTHSLLRLLPWWVASGCGLVAGANAVWIISRTDPRWDTKPVVTIHYILGLAPLALLVSELVPIIVGPILPSWTPWVLLLLTNITILFWLFGITRNLRLRRNLRSGLSTS